MLNLESQRVIARSDSDEAIHGPASGDMDCFASLAMTVKGDSAPLSRQPHIQQPPSLVLQELLHRARGGDLALVGVGFVVLLDIVEAIEIVDHDAGGLAKSLPREVTKPVDPLQPCAVADVEARHRIDQPALRRAGFEEITRGERFEQSTQWR